MLSVIVPIYNAEKYLEKCIESICQQTYRDLDIILIDDGSQDQSGAICDQFKAIDGRIRVFHKENGGVSSARNRGLDVAQGEYITFIDSDDWINPDLLERLMAQIGQADMAVGGYTTVSKAGNVEQKYKDESLTFPECVCSKFDELYANNFFNTPIGKIYKRNILGTQRFDSSVALGEDFLFNLEYLSKCHAVKTVSVISYFYNCMNVGAATKKLRENDIEQIYFLYQAGRNFLCKYYPNTGESVELKKRFCLNGINLIQLICYSDKSQIEKSKLAKKLLTNDEFIKACNKDYSLPKRYDIPRKLCANGSWNLLQVFFVIKKKLSTVRGS